MGIKNWNIMKKVMKMLFFFRIFGLDFRKIVKDLSSENRLSNDKKIGSFLDTHFYTKFFDTDFFDF